jgi:tyrosinase
MAIRESIRGLAESPAKLQLLRRACTRMMSLGDDRGYEWLASVHFLPFPGWCEHGTLLFLPWHRAYLYFFELGLQTRLGAGFSERQPADPELADVGLPWWDWASAESHVEGIPEPYDVAEADGDENPLRRGEITNCPGRDNSFVGVWSTALLRAVRAQLPGALTPTGTPRTLRDPDEADELPRQATLDNIVLQQSTFESFSNSLESVHNDVHVWVGGAMSQVPTSSYDPIFWSHHAMIDRLWYVWQNSALGQDPPAVFLDTVLRPFPMTVRDTLRIDQLGYDYAVQVSGGG